MGTERLIPTSLAFYEPALKVTYERQLQDLWPRPSDVAEPQPAKACRRRVRPACSESAS